MAAISFKVRCSNCQKIMPINLKEDYLGKKISIKCSHCLQPFVFNAPTRDKLSALPKAQPKPEEEDRFKTTINPSFANKEKILVIEIVKNAFATEQKFEITQPHMTIGRLSYMTDAYQPDLPVETTDNFISKKHAVFKKHANGLFSIADAGSTNGTFLNNEKLEPTDELILSDGDLLQIGRTQINIKIV